MEYETIEISGNPKNDEIADGNGGFSHCYFLSYGENTIHRKSVAGKAVAQ